MYKKLLLSSAVLIAWLALSLSVFAGHHSKSEKSKKHIQKQDIVDTAVAAGSFKTLAAALEAAGLIDTLKSDGPFTVFAPTDEAFAKSKQCDDGSRK